MGIQQVSSERAALVSNRESEEKGDLRLAGSRESTSIRTADAQAGRAAEGSDVKAAQDLNPNKHNGSAGGDRLESIQIFALDEGGKQKVVAERQKEAKPQPEITDEYLREKAKQPDIWARKFVEDMDKAEKLPAPYKDAQIAKVLKDAEAVYRLKGQAEKPQEALDQMDTGTLLAQEVKRNPAAEPVQNLHTWAKQLPEGPEKIPEAAQKLADHLSAAIMTGVKVSQVLAGYSQEVAQSGAYSRPLRDLQTLTTLANERWQAMPLEKRTEKARELVAEMDVGSVIGAADRLAKSGKLIEALEDLAKYARDLTALGSEKARQAISKFLGDAFQPKGLTTNGFEMPIPKQEPENVLFMKGDKGLKDVRPSEKVIASEKFNDHSKPHGVN
ncbi:MAG: hypothetical protein BWY75_00391 [bacterium ADurb.Bin425]|nr:MAG: hypothetical protein BWY75_00391 [bacterium ADurb.Bin425]